MTSAGLAVLTLSVISIHTPRVGSDYAGGHGGNVGNAISIHTPAWGDGKSSLSTAEGKMLKPREPEPFVLLILHQIMRVQVTPAGRAVSFTLTS